MSKLWGTCSSNLTRFQLNRQKFVFFQRGGWKPFKRETFGYLYIKCGLIVCKFILLTFCNLFLACASQKTHFWHSKNGKHSFYSKKKKTFFGNIVRHSKMHVWVQYMAILKKPCHECGDDVRQLPWKPWIFVDNSSFLWTLFRDSYRISSLYFLWILGHI